MRRHKRKAFAWAFCALFGCISFCGNGLHCVVGHWHTCTQSQHDSGHCHDHCDHDDECAATDFDCNAGIAVAQAVSSGSRHEDHNCPICAYFAQAQLDIAFAFEPADAFVTPTLSLAIVSRLIAFVGVYRGRAPPDDLLG